MSIGLVEYLQRECDVNRAGLSTTKETLMRIGIVLAPPGRL